MRCQLKGIGFIFTVTKCSKMDCGSLWICIFFFNFFLIFYLFMIERERERGRDTSRGRKRLHAPGARRGIRSGVSRIAPWAKGRRQTTAPPRDPWICILCSLYLNKVITKNIYQVCKITRKICILLLKAQRDLFPNDFRVPKLIKNYLLS